MRAFLVFAVLATVSQPAFPAGKPAWIVDDARSTVSFRYSEDGKPVDGGFGQFSALIEFDPTKLGETTAIVAVSTASIDVDDAMREGVLLTPPWFDTRAFPEAIFELTDLTLVADDRYRAQGLLTIKAVRKPVDFELNVSLTRGNARVQGTLQIERSEYRLRDDLLESVISVGDTVSIGFDLVARSPH